MADTDPKAAQQAPAAATPAPETTVVACPKCQTVLAVVVVKQPHISGVHCGICGADFGVSLTLPESAESVADDPKPGSSLTSVAK